MIKHITHTIIKHVLNINTQYNVLYISYTHPILKQQHTTSHRLANTQSENMHSSIHHITITVRAIYIQTTMHDHITHTMNILHISYVKRMTKHMHTFLKHKKANTHTSDVLYCCSTYNNNYVIVLYA